jgi:hypothetical protein
VLQELDFYIGLYNSQLPAGQETVFDSEDKLFKGKGVREVTLPVAERHILVTLSTKNGENDEYSTIMQFFIRFLSFIDY